MKIFYANAAVFAITPASAYLPGEVATDSQSGLQGVLKPNGKWLSMQPDGSQQDRDTVGAWETVQIGSGVNVLIFPNAAVPFNVAYIGG